MKVHACRFGFISIIIALIILGPLSLHSLSADSAPTSFQIRRVVEEKDSANSETLPFANARPGAETSLRVMKQAVLDAADVASATTQKDPITGDNSVRVTLTEKGKERFAKLTEQSIGKRLAVIVDGKIMIAPVIRERIAGGSLVVTGNLTSKDAEELAEKFNRKK